MNNALISLLLVILLLFSLSKSHTFEPYKFSLSCPEKVRAAVGKEFTLDITIKNEGMNDDVYSVEVQSSLNILVRPDHLNTSLIPSKDITKANFIVQPMSAIGNKEIKITVTSLYSYNPTQGIVISKNCTIQLDLSYITLGNKKDEIYLFSIYFFLFLLFIFLIKFFL